MSYDLKCRELVSPRCHKFRATDSLWCRCVKCDLMRVENDNDKYEYSEFNTRFAITINSLSDNCRECLTDDELIIKKCLE